MFDLVGSQYFEYPVAPNVMVVKVMFIARRSLIICVF